MDQHCHVSHRLQLREDKLINDSQLETTGLSCQRSWLTPFNHAVFLHRACKKCQNIPSTAIPTLRTDPSPLAF